DKEQRGNAPGAEEGQQVKPIAGLEGPLRGFPMRVGVEPCGVRLSGAVAGGGKGFVSREDGERDEKCGPPESRRTGTAKRHEKHQADAGDAEVLGEKGAGGEGDTGGEPRPTVSL